MPLTLVGYYQCDSIGPTAPDAVGPNPLNFAGTGPVVDPSGILGNYYEVNQSLAPAYLSSSSADFEFAGGSFLIRFWIKNPFLDSGLASMQHLFSRCVGDFDPGFRVYLVMTTPTSGALGFLCVPGGLLEVPITWDQPWQRVVVWHDIDNAVMGIVIGNDVPTFGFSAGATAPSAADLIVCGDMGSIIRIDEIGFWKGGVWTQEQLDCDWNSGFGRTYDELPPDFDCTSGNYPSPPPPSISCEANVLLSRGKCFQCLDEKHLILAQLQLLRLIFTQINPTPGGQGIGILIDGDNLVIDGDRVLIDQTTPAIDIDSLMLRSCNLRCLNEKQLNAVKAQQVCNWLGKLTSSDRGAPERIGILDQSLSPLLSSTELIVIP